jgi:hypothetical protein
MTGVAQSSVTPSSFVVRSTTVDAQFLLASNTTTAIAGISGPGTRYPPYASMNDGNIAIAGENFQLFMPPMKEAPLQLGGTVAAGDLLTSDGSGHGITATANAQVGARALMAGVSGNIITVQPLFGPAS